jgi:outer membrane protein TolC
LKPLKLLAGIIILLSIVNRVEIKAQDAKINFSLNDCINYAHENNSDIKKASIEEEKSGKKINEIIGSGLPQVTLSGNLVNNLELPTTLINGDYFGAPGTMIAAKFGTKYSYTFTGEVTQMIFNGSFWVGLSAAKYSNLYYQQNRELVSENVEYDVATAYYQILVVQKQIQLLQQNQKLISKSLSDTKLLFENGKTKEVDVDRIKVSLNNIEYQLKKANETLKQSYRYLKFKMGMPVASEISLADSLYFSQDSLLVQSINTLEYEKDDIVAFDNRNDYKILQTSLELQTLDKKNQIAQFLPSISAFGSYSYSGLRTGFDLFDSKKEWFKYYSIGLQFKLPIFTGGQTIAKIQQSSLNVDALKEEVKKVENGINLQVSNAITKYNNAFDNTKTNKLNINLAKKVYDITLLEYKEGVTNAASLVDAETKLREAQTNFVNSLLELYVAKFDLEKARGTLTSYLKNIGNKN